MFVDQAVQILMLVDAVLEDSLAVLCVIVRFFVGRGVCRATHYKRKDKDIQFGIAALDCFDYFDARRNFFYVHMMQS